MKYVQLILLFMLISFGLAATTINVTTTTDEDNGFLGGGNGISLREAIIYSSSGDEIVLSGSTYVLTLTSTEEGFNLTPGTGDLDIQHDLTITGNGATIDANGIDRVIQIASGVEVVIDHVTITGGRSTFTPGVNLLTHGGGIYTEGDLTLNNCSLDDNISITHGGNQSSQGGGIYNLSGVLTLNDCTISNNQAGTANQGQHGGGIYNSTAGTLNMTGCTALNNKANDQPLGAGDGGAVYSLGAITLTNCTFSGNTASRFGGGVTFHGDNPSLINFCTISNNTAFKGGGIFSGLDGSGDIANTIIAGNTSTDNLEDADVLNDYNSLGYNLIGIFPNANNDLPLSSDHFGTSGSPLSANLSPLASNGGPTQTHALLFTSPALNGANPNATVTEDQRGTQRPQDCPSDIGAYESSLSTLSPSTYYADTDMDGFGDPNNSTQACIQPDGFVTNSSDCNDNDSAINPDATEVCDGIDNNCDTQIDNGTLATYYADSDSDGFGDPNNATEACAQPSGFVSDNTDCDDNDADEFPGQDWYLDADGDGYSDGNSTTACLRPADYFLASELTATSGDCNDNDSAINPDAPEACDGIDNNCDTQIDDGTLATYYADSDSDGFGDPNNATEACAQPSGFVSDNTDCDDNDADEFPGQTWFLDADGDGYSDGTSTTDCERPLDYYLATELTATSGDCNDNDSDINPDATEACDGIDNNCDTQIDEGTLATYYADSDSDGFGDPNNSTQACAQPSGFVSDNTDCDDNDADEFPGQTWFLDADDDGYSDGTSTTDCERPLDYYLATELTETSGDCNDNDSAINPDAPEACDGIDNNCDTQIDEGTLATYYADSDSDGFGDPNNSTEACAQPSGFVTDNTDCDDNDADEFPGQPWYLDADGDGYSDGTSTTACLRPTDYFLSSELTATSGDCNDNDSAINPDATEACDGVDNNCDTQIDEGTLATYYADSDSDGFGDPNNATEACAQPSGFVSDNTDCDDNDADEFPGQTWYLDADGDGYSDGNSTTACLRPADYFLASELTATSGDCNDNDSAINPDATEACDGVDNNCDTQIDEGTLATYYADSDSDGFGDPNNATEACAQPSGFVSDNTDCDDNDADEFPGQTWFLDADGDGYSDGTSTTACEKPADYFLSSELTATSGDCDDSDSAINPGATEVCDGIDNNCDTQIDDGTLATYYADSDSDGFGDPNNSTQACAQPSGFVSDNTDCDDNDADEFPGQTWFLDADGDGYSDGTSTTACLRPADYFLSSELTATSGDCNDNDSDINPDATEICDGVDNNCDMQVDEGLTEVFYADLDGDGYGDPNNPRLACTQPSGFVMNDLDCDDSNANINPDAIEVCNGIDDDCDGFTDSEDNDIPATWTTVNLGNEGQGNTYSYDPCPADDQGQYIIESGANNLSNPANDNLATLVRPLCGNGGIQVKIEAVENGYAGLMIRESNPSDAKMAAVYSNLTNLLRWETRYNNGSNRSSSNFFKPFPIWLRLVRQGNWIKGYYSQTGSNWQIIHQVYLPMDQCVEMGLATFTYDPNGQAYAVLSNISSIGSTGSSLAVPNAGTTSSQETLRVKAFPNPASETLTISLEQPLKQDGQAILRNNFGQAVQRKALPAGETSFDWELLDIPAGVYFLEVRTASNDRQILKVIKS